MMSYSTECFCGGLKIAPYVNNKSIEGWACLLLETKDIRGSTHDNALIKSPSTLNLFPDFVFMATRVPVLESHLAKRTKLQQYKAVARQKLVRDSHVEKPWSRRPKKLKVQK